MRASDSTHIKILKLEIMTNMASAGNIGAILREFRSYITGQDRACVAAAIQAIGRCAATIEEVTDTCLNGLVHLLSNSDQAVVAESVVVIKKLLQTQVRLPLSKRIGIGSGFSFSCCEWCGLFDTCLVGMGFEP